MTGAACISSLEDVNITRRAPLILGHRGYRARFPENTLLAFREALAAEADGIECDLQKSADGRYVVIHDPTTDRVTGAKGEVARMRLDELKRLDFGWGERILSLEDLLGWLPAEAYLDLELKEETLTEADCEPIARLLDSSRGRKNFMISSFEPRLLRPFRRKGFTVGFLLGEEAAQRGLVRLACVILRLRPQFLNLPIDMFALVGRRRALRIIALLRICGFSLLFWTVNAVAEAALVVRHARIIVTDEVDLIGKSTHS